MKKIARILPGLFLCMIIAVIARFIGELFPALGSGLFAILIGILIGNLKISSSPRWSAGVKFSESNLLYYSIVLLGATLTFQTIMEMGVSGLSFIVIQMSLTIVFVVWLGKKLRFGEDFSLLMASGNAVCGSSAIAATGPAIQAKSSDIALSVTLVNLLGSVLMIFLPVITNLVFSNAVIPSAALIGGTLQSVGQVVASGSIVGEEVKDQAAVFKISRIIFLVAVVFVLKQIKFRKQESKVATKDKFSFGKIIPWYVAGFLLLCCINSLLQPSATITNPIKELGGYLEIIALAGIGMGVKIKELIKSGWNLTIYAGGVGVFQISVALLLILLLL